MKQLFLLIIIFALGAVTYAFLNPFLLSLIQPKEATPSDTAVTAPTTTTQTSVTKTAEPTPVPKEESPVTITEDGALLDGPFAVQNARGEDTNATVEIVRSPEETLLQFKNFTSAHSPNSDIYFSNDLKASSYISLGFARLNEDVLVYGIPLDADLSKYSYILIYDVKNKTVEYSAKIQ